MAYLIAVANQKGGVAKTTTSISLGGALSLSGNEVLLIDLDPQGDLSLALGFQPKNMRHSIMDVILGTSSISSVSRESAVPGLDIIPANNDLEIYEKFLMVRRNYHLLLREKIHCKYSSTSYNFIIIDCPPSMGSLTYNALFASDLLIVPTQPEYFSVYALRNMMSHINRIQKTGNPELTYRILITMRDRRNRIHRTLSEQLQNTCSHNLYDIIIDSDTNLRESAVVGLPITQYLSKSRGAIQYQSLAQEILNNVQGKIPSIA